MSVTPSSSLPETAGRSDRQSRRRQPRLRDTAAGADPAAGPRELGGPAGPEPTRYGDWERRGRCIDF
ncbi:MAG: DUF1674 domain-containing protein [Gammaproteobacteria bacterium]|nr:MAG: DUF1674 domain-containing protein [Gammaproteobacteria bacterium]